MSADETAAYFAAAGGLIRFRTRRFVMRRNQSDELTKRPRQRKGKTLPSPFEMVNQSEIGVKVNNLLRWLRGPDDKLITKAKFEIFKGLNLTPRAIAFGGGPKTEAEAYWKSRIKAETGFLRDFLSGLIDIFDDYFRRLEIRLEPRSLLRVWLDGIEPRFISQVQDLRNYLDLHSPGHEAAFFQSQMREFDKGAERILNEGSQQWREKIEEAISAEKFGQFGVEASSTGTGTRKAGENVVRLIEVPPDSCWEDVHMTMYEHELEVSVGEKTVRIGFQGAGFEEKRRGKVPDRLWFLLRVLAMNGGVLSFDSPELSEKGRVTLRQNISKLRHRLNELLGIKGHPFEPTAKTRLYRTRLHISTPGGVLFPTPGETTWMKVSITELPRNAILISVPSQETISVRSPDDDLRMEAALRENQLERTYTLRDLRLVNSDGSPAGPGSALLRVLRAGGKVKASRDDQALLLLGKILCDFMQIDDPAFQFSLAKKLWIAEFHASSCIAQPDA
jgi:hypothetical protein